MGNSCRRTSELVVEFDTPGEDLSPCSDKVRLIKNYEALEKKEKKIRNFIDSFIIDGISNAEVLEFKNKFRAVLEELLALIRDNRESIVNTIVLCNKELKKTINHYHAIDYDLEVFYNKELTPKTKCEITRLIERKLELGRNVYSSMSFSMSIDKKMLNYLELVIRINILSWCYIYQVKFDLCARGFNM